MNDTDYNYLSSFSSFFSSEETRRILYRDFISSNSSGDEEPFNDTISTVAFTGTPNTTTSMDHIIQTSVVTSSGQKGIEINFTQGFFVGFCAGILTTIMVVAVVLAIIRMRRRSRQVAAKGPTMEAKELSALPTGVYCEYRLKADDKASDGDGQGDNTLYSELTLADGGHTADADVSHEETSKPARNQQTHSFRPLSSGSYVEFDTHEYTNVQMCQGYRQENRYV